MLLTKAKILLSKNYKFIIYKIFIYIQLIIKVV